MKINSVEIKDSIAQYVNECRSIVDTCKKELRELTDEEQNRLDELKKAIADKKAELVKLQEELDKIEIPTEDVERDEQEVDPEPDGAEAAEDVAEDEEDEEKNNFKRKMKKEKFSLLGAIRSIANREEVSAVNKAVMAEGAKSLRKSQIPFNGDIQIPTETRATISVAADGDDVVATDVFHIMEPLRAKSTLAAAGARFIPNLTNDCLVPIMSAANCAWAGENAAAQDAAATFSNVKMQPKRMTAYLNISKEFLAQDGAGAEEILRKNLVDAIAAKLESTILGEGVGSGDEPAGMFNGADLTQVKDFKGVTDMEAKVEEANVTGTCHYILSPKAKAALRNMTTGGKTTALVYENNEIAGTPAFSTTNVAADKFVYGDFSNLVIASFGGGIDLTVDPFTKADEGIVRLIINSYWDAKVARPEAFAFGTTAIA